MKRPVRVASILVAALIAVTSCMPAPAADKHPSWTTRSYYMGNASGTAARNLGCQNGDKQGRMTLFFGAPTSMGLSYGATLWGAPNQTTAQIGNLVREFVRGYASCRRSPSYRLLIGVGTSNSTVNGRPDSWLRGHGRAWATMTRNLGQWARQYYPGHARVNGAWDAEPSWSSFGKAEVWMHGYDDTASAPVLLANNSADGCPQSSSGNGACSNGWNQHRVWHLAWQHDPALPIPQIYATSGANARQWHMIDAYGHLHQRDGMTFYGVMSQRAACGQTSSSCSGINATPHQSYDMLLRQLYTRDYTRQGDLPGMTDVQWHN